MEWQIENKKIEEGNEKQQKWYKKRKMKLFMNKYRLREEEKTKLSRMEKGTYT